MNPFLALQSADPFDPMSSLILADHLEEQGDTTAAGALRGLATCGIPSLHALALEATLCPVPFSPDLFRYGQGFGPEIERGDGFGDGLADEDEDGSGVGSGDGFGYTDGEQDRSGPGNGIGYARTDGTGLWDGSGFGSGDGSSYRRGAAGLGGEDDVSSPERIAMVAGQQLGLPA